MAGIGAIAVVAPGTNGDGAAVSGKGDAFARAIASVFSIDVSAELLPAGGPFAAPDRQGAGRCVFGQCLDVFRWVLNQLATVLCRLSPFISAKERLSNAVQTWSQNSFY